MSFSSSAKTPCPICGRSSSGCRVVDDLLFCRIGNSCSPFQKHPQLKKGDVIGEWACVAINADTECATFKPHEERAPINHRQWRYFTPDGRSATHNRTDYSDKSKEVTWSRGAKPNELLPLWYESLPDSGETVFVVEGETCAEALKTLGLWVTSVPNGAGSWRSSMPDLPKFQHNRLVLVPDRDRPGVELMQRIADVFPGSKWLLVQPTNDAAWNDPDDGYDIADWCDDGAGIAALRGAVRLEAPVLPSLPWYERLGQHHTEKGALTRLKTLELSQLLTSSLGGSIRFNSLQQAVEIDGTSLDDITMRLAYVNMQHAGLDITTQAAQDAILNSATSNPYNPVTQYLDSCNDPLPEHTWDNIAGELLGGHALPFDNSALRKWLIFAVARAYKPGCPCGFVHILAGDQHLHKTRFYNTLASEPWFYEGFIKSSKDADDILGLHMRWICEWGELDGGIKNHESAGLKNFITRKTDLVREPYGRNTRERPRSFVLCGTTNKRDGFFSDETGNRRFVIFTIEERIDSEKIEHLRDRIWASARADFMAGKTWYLDDAETLENNTRNRGLYQEDAWRDRVEAWLSMRSFEYVLATEILSNCLEIPIDRQDQRMLGRVNRILTSLYWIKTRKQINGAFRHVWRRSDTIG